MRNGARGAVLDSALYVNEVTAARITESVERTTAEHTVEVFTLDLMAGVILTFFVFEILTTVIHTNLFSKRI